MDEGEGTWGRLLHPCRGRDGKKSLSDDWNRSRNRRLGAGKEWPSRWSSERIQWGGRGFPREPRQKGVRLEADLVDGTEVPRRVLSVSVSLPRSLACLRPSSLQVGMVAETSEVPITESRGHRSLRGSPPTGLRDSPTVGVSPWIDPWGGVVPTSAT